eukprot:3409490-Pyramimonas_sp.AAC.1
MIPVAASPPEESRAPRNEASFVELLVAFRRQVASASQMSQVFLFLSGASAPPPLGEPMGASAPAGMSATPCQEGIAFDHGASRTVRGGWSEDEAAADDPNDASAGGPPWNFAESGAP